MYVYTSGRNVCVRSTGTFTYSFMRVFIHSSIMRSVVCGAPLSVDKLSHTYRNTHLNTHTHSLHSDMQFRKCNWFKIPVKLNYIRLHALPQMGSQGHTHSLTHSLSPSLSHTHTHTHTQNSQ